MTIIRSLLVATVSVTALACSSTADAALLFHIAQAGSDVVATATGSIDVAGLAGLPMNAPSSILKFINGSQTELVIGNDGNVDRYLVDIPFSFGGGFRIASFGTGPTVGFSGSQLDIAVGYVSGTALSSSSTFSNATITSLGLTSGTYSFSAGTNLVTLVIDPVAAAVPEPATWAMMIVGFGAIGGVLRRRRVAVAFAR